MMMESYTRYMTPPEPMPTELPSFSDLELTYPRREPSSPVQYSSTGSPYAAQPLMSSYPQLPTPSTLRAPSRTPSGDNNGQRASPYPHPEIRPKVETEDSPAVQSPLTAKQESTEGISTTSDFVKKLYKLLEDDSYPDIVSWGPRGDCFVVKDMNAFTTTVLPRMFKHSNFASFVRQLNKYDFHKIRINDDESSDDHTWAFRHPDFRAHAYDALEHIKRKVPGARKAHRSASPSLRADPARYNALAAQVAGMVQRQDELAAHIVKLEGQYAGVRVEMQQFQGSLTQQDGLVRNMIQCCVQLENRG